MKLASEIYEQIFLQFESQFSEKFAAKVKKLKNLTLKLLKMENRNIDIQTKVFDFKLLDYVTIAEAFETMKQAMFVIKYKNEFFIFDKGDLLRTLVTGSGIAYECKNISEALHFRESDIKPEKCYFKLPINFNAYIEINNFCQSIIEDQMVEVFDTNETLLAMLNENAIAKDAHLNYRFESMDATSGDHCQAGSDRRVFKLQSLKHKDIDERYFNIVTSNDIQSEINTTRRQILLALELYSEEDILFFLRKGEEDIEEVKAIYNEILHSKEIKQDFINVFNFLFFENDERQFKIDEIRINIDNEDKQKHYYYLEKVYGEPRYRLNNTYFFLPIEIIVSFDQYGLREYVNFEKTKNLIETEDQQYFYEHFKTLRNKIVPPFIETFSKKLNQRNLGLPMSISRPSEIRYEDIIKNLYEKFIFTVDSLYSL